MGILQIDPVGQSPVDAVVVAGGTSRRLGQDKALVSRGHRTQVAHVVSALQGLGGSVVVAHGRRVLDVAGTTGVADPPGMMGPLAGIVAGLAVAASDVVAVVAVDLVAPDVDLLRALAEHVRADPLSPGAMPLQDGRPQPLHAVLRRDLHRTLVTAGQDRVLAAMAVCGVESVPEAEWRRWAPDADPARDIDTPADLTDLPPDESPRLVT